MSYLSITLERELSSMTALRNTYEQQLEALPKGSLRERVRGGKTYYYLACRKDGKVVSEYVGNDTNAVTELRERIERRKKVEALLKSIKNELRLMNRALEVSV